LRGINNKQKFMQEEKRRKEKIKNLSQKIVAVIAMFLFLVFPHVSHANPIVTLNLYSPFESGIVNNYFLIWFPFFLIGLLLEIFVIYFSIRRHINEREWKKVLFRIFIPITALNIFTMVLVQIFAIFIAFFAEIFPIIIESFVVYWIIKKANKRNLLTGIVSKKNMIFIIFVANMLSFASGFFINYVYLECEKSLDFAIKEVPSYCSLLPIISEQIKDEENKLSDIETVNKPKKTDSDIDGLSDITENLLNTNYTNSDSDGDGFSDYEEIKNGYDPLKKSPGDKYPEEYYQFIKEEIRNVDEENYYEIFQGE
jgi:hypothetical protein